LIVNPSQSAAEGLPDDGRRDINDGAPNNGQPLDQIRQILNAAPNCQPVSNEAK
jgi:hypothetical protein